MNRQSLGRSLKVTNPLPGNFEKLLDLAFFEDNVLANFRVVFFKFELVFASFFVGCVKITGTS